MKLVYMLVIFSMMGLVIPAYAQNPRISEIEQQMMEEVRICKAEIDSNEELTAAEKTVAKRNCEREISIKYENLDKDSLPPGELRAKLQNIQRCEDWHPQYRYLTEEQFQLQKNADIVRDCILLYNDPIWDYAEKDRPNKLVERLDEIKAELPDIPEPQPIAIDIEIPTLDSEIIDVPETQDRVTDLEEKIKLLEDEVARKDAIIKEQLKTIMDLFNRIRNVIFEPLHLPWTSI